MLLLAILALAASPATAEHQPAVSPDATVSSLSSFTEQSFRASAPAPGDWGFAEYGKWVQVGNGSKDWCRVRASSSNGVDFQMQVHFKDANGRTCTHTFGGLQNWVDATVQGVGRGPVYVRFKVSTLNNKRGASISGTAE